MQTLVLRDQDEGTGSHRFGTEREAVAVEVSEALVLVGYQAMPVRRLVEVFDRLHLELVPDYIADRSGLDQCCDETFARLGQTGRVNDTTLAPDREQRLASLDVTYAEVGHTRGELPPGYHHVAREVSLGFGPDRFAQATEALFEWQVQRRAGVRVIAGSERVVDGAVAVLLLGLGRLSLRAPVRVVYVVNEPRLKGFAYGTLPGHPESGEEAFLIELREDGVVVCRITAFSRPVSWLARLGGPFATLTQAWVTGRYLRALFE